MMNNNVNEQSSFITEANSHSKSSPSVVEKFVIRLPRGLRDQIKNLSEQHRRSMNSEIIMVLEQHIQQNTDTMRVDFGDNINQFNEKIERRSQPRKEQLLSDKLEELPADKKEALLSLLT